MKGKEFHNVKMKRCWRVMGWATEFDEGWGCIINESDGYLSKVLFFDGKDFSFDSTTNCYFDLKSANIALLKEKQSYKNHLEERFEDYKNKLKELKITSI